MLNAKKRRMPCCDEVLEFWKPRLIEMGKVDEKWNGRSTFYCNHTPAKFKNEYHYFHCFACNEPADVERAHIEPRSSGHPDYACNLHLLCFYCHKESEDLFQQDYWDWFIDQTSTKMRYFAAKHDAHHFYDDPDGRLEEIERVWKKANRLEKLCKEKKIKILDEDWKSERVLRVMCGLVKQWGRPERLTPEWDQAKYYDWQCFNRSMAKPKMRYKGLCEDEFTILSTAVDAIKGESEGVLNWCIPQMSSFRDKMVESGLITVETIKYHGEKDVMVKATKKGLELMAEIEVGHHPCFHADPRFKDLEPGEEAIIQGKIIFFEGPLAEFDLKKYGWG